LALNVQHQDFAVAHDGGQQIVEVVGHSSRQPPHRFHLLGLQQLMFHLSFFGDIPETPDPPQNGRADPLGLGIALKHPAVGKFYQVIALQLRLGV
jgi:hypothetical protein